MGNYEEELPFAGFVNKNADEKTRVDNYFVDIEEAMKRSISIADVKAKDERRKDERTAQEIKQRKHKLILRIIAVVLALEGFFVVGEKISKQQDIKVATTMSTQDAVDKLSNLLIYRNGGSITYSTDNGIRSLFQSLTTNDYSKLTVDSLGQIYSFKLVLGDKEFEEFIKSLTYLENGEVRHYVSFKQFLNINGFGSEKEFINKAEAELLDDYGNQSHKVRGGI